MAVLDHRERSHMTKKPLAGGALIALLSAAVLTISACSSSGSKGDASSTANTSAVGGLIPIQSSAYNQPDAKTGLDAAISAVNAAGGVSGHPLKLDFCDTQYTVNGELACARQMVTDKVSAVIDP